MSKQRYLFRCRLFDSLQTHLDLIYHCEYTNKVPGIDLIYGVDPGVGEIWRDTITASIGGQRVLVDGDRVHIVFRGEDQWPDYIQYDLDGNVTGASAGRDAYASVAKL